MTDTPLKPPDRLLAIDSGLRTGLALYDRDGRLLWYRSHNLGSASRLKRAAHRLLGEIPGLTRIVLEGGGPLADHWRREADRRRIPLFLIHAEDWREQILLPREQRSGFRAKESADELARRVIAWSRARRPTSLRHDAAEAILIGLWGVLEAGWIEELPGELRR